MKIEVKGPIVDSQSALFYKFFGLAHTSPESVTSLLTNEDGDDVQDVELEINSPGGSVSAASEIYTALKSSKAKVTAKIVGIAASAASIIAMGADKVIMSPTSQMMIHKASVEGGGGNADDFEHLSDVLNTVDESIVMAYESKTGMKDTDILNLMAKETYMNAKTAVQLGFADEIMFVNDDDSEFTNSVAGMVDKEKINTFLNFLHQGEIKNASQAQSKEESKNTLREQKLAILQGKEV